MIGATVCAFPGAQPKHYAQLARQFVPQRRPAVALLSVALLATWPFLPQELNPALIPLIIATGWRSWQISKGSSIKQTG
jgi:hypothetical protein